MPLTVQQFLQSLADSGILAKDDYARVEQAWPAARHAEDAKPLAIDLVRQKLLTQFQALNLYHGKAQFLVLGNYILLDILGEGGMGKVYKAVHGRMQRTVALKLLPAGLTKETETLRRFQREAQAAAQLVHPNIVTAYDADEARGVHFLVMEYVDGQDLGSYLKEHGVLPVAMAVDCVMQAAKGLEYAHAKGVVHRDIKPSNLLLSRDGVVKVMDLGLARFDPSQHVEGSQHVDASLRDAEASLGETRPREGGLSAGDPRRERTELTRQGQIIGTVSYMAPEQTVSMGLADERSDIYALDCTLYRLLTGDVPYPRETAAATMAAQREAPIPSLRKFRRDVTPQLDAVMRKMLAKQPTERYQSMGEVIAALKALTCESGPAQHVSQKAAGDDFKSDLLSSLLGLGPGGAGALLDDPANQNWNPTDYAHARTANHSRTAVNSARAPGRPTTEESRTPPRSFPWGVAGLGGALVLIGAMVLIYLRTAPPKADVIAVGNLGANKSPEGETSPERTPGRESETKAKGQAPAIDRRVAEWFAGTYGTVLIRSSDDKHVAQFSKRE